MAIVKKKKTAKPEAKSKTKSSGSITSLRDRAKNKTSESKKKGFSAMREAKKEQTSNYSNFRNAYVPKGETKTYIFLLDDLIPVRTHSISQRLPNGKEFFPEFLCTEGDDCKFCSEAQAGNKSVKAANTTGVTLVLDVEGYADKDGKEFPFQVRPMIVNPTLSSVLEHKDNQYGLLYTVYDMKKLDRGHALDEVRDRKDVIQRYKNVAELLQFLKSPSGNKDTYKQIKEALDEHGDFKTWLKEVIIPDFLNPNMAKLSNMSSSSQGDDDEDEDEGAGKFSFRRDKKSGSKSPARKRSRLR